MTHTTTGIPRIAPSEGFVADEERNGYLVTAHMKRVWAIQMELAQELLDVCRRHGLKVFADGGTMLGTIRHQGFIPWDDDMDFCMMRDDYDRLCSVAADEFRHPYFFQTIYSDSHYTRRHAQLRHEGTTAYAGKARKARSNSGIFIDIFVLDAFPNTPRAAKRHLRAAGLAKQRLKLVSRLVNALPEGLYAWLRRREAWLSDVRQFRRFEEVLRSVSPDATPYVSQLSFRTSDPIQCRDCYDEVLWKPFEYIQLPVPAGYDRLLTNYYGDYMTPVQAPTNHGTMHFTVDRSYKDVLQ